MASCSFGIEPPQYWLTMSSIWHLSSPGTGGRYPFWFDRRAGRPCQQSDIATGVGVVRLRIYIRFLFVMGMVSDNRQQWSSDNFIGGTNFEHSFIP
ncbi:hypothetical protein TNCV_4645331 [Trichonephila clavipes]|nr:hypothetical protein TNCV_4645331 [Trichonephila clavipes]